PEQELRSPTHAHVSDNDNVGTLLARYLDDRLSWLGVELEPRPAAYSGETLSQLRELSGRAGGPPVAAGHVLGRDDAYQEQLGGVAVGHLGRPLDRAGRGVRSVGGDQDPLHQLKPPFKLAEPQIYATAVNHNR